MKILGTGLNGLVGSRVVELLKSSFEFENVSRATGVDITDFSQVLNAVSKSSAEIVLHLAAKTDVDGCEKERDLGIESDAWKINVEGTRNVAQACEKFGKKLIHTSTDFVFDGKIGEDEFYTEESIPSPINWYSKTKHEGEKIVQQSSCPWVIVRLAYPYRANFEKPDFFRAIKKRLESGQPVIAVTDQIFTPTLIDDFAHCLKILIKNNNTGIYHTAGGDFLSPYDAVNVIAETFGLGKNSITKTTREEFFKDRAPRPFRLALKNVKIESLGVKNSTFREGLFKIKEQINK